MNWPDGLKCFLLAMVVCLSAQLSMAAVESFASPTGLFTDQEIDNLLAPIALYPDPLLAEMLPASTYPAEIADADLWLNNGGDLSRIDEWNWDESVKATAHYPGILKMMAGNMNWTTDLGDAFLNQPEAVASAIQRLRWQARNAGNLESNSQQTIIIEGDYIEIIPTQPQYIYIPQYDPSVIYLRRWTPGHSPFITFGLGLAIGSWLSMDFDWGHHHVIYHGWNRSGWVNKVRPYIHVSNVYVNRSRPYITPVWRHDVSHGNPTRYRDAHPGVGPNVSPQLRMPEVRGRAAVPSKPSGVIFGPRGNAHSFSIRGKESLGIVPTRPTGPTQGLPKRPAAAPSKVSQRPMAPAPALSTRPSPARPAGGSLQAPGAPSTVFGGYRGAGEAKTQSLRGQASRRTTEEARPSAAPARRESAPAGKKSTQIKRFR